MCACATCCLAAGAADACGDRPYVPPHERRAARRRPVVEPPSFVNSEAIPATFWARMRVIMSWFFAS